MRENKDKVSVIHFEWVTCAVKEKNLPLFGAAGHAANGPACIGISRDDRMFDVWFNLTSTLTYLVTFVGLLISALLFQHENS